ncbi:glutamyl-tRNA reductase [Acinetobacter boissieri]|uniref:Glutamyl-tRNA reductase n=1 Tax=Acinetobacter boissieri TaxID=1219383 RepID=A0A1G6H7F0_9GAMM|nr:glutamyl-tRNA reductase [Acinetobacter boissieri]SDB89875.1 glutamyl-tRNA reductase [Acinetobacter boissieri]
MTFFALGVNHHTATVELRERIAFNADRLSELLLVQSKQDQFNDLVVVSTCNRTEVYANAHSREVLLEWLAGTNNVAVSELATHVYCHEDIQAVSHLMRVASGLDSLMLGEPQILGQVKSALSLAKNQGTVSSSLNRIFDYAFYAAKRVRSETAVGSHAVSMGYAVAQLAHQVFSHPEKLVVLMVAAGEMNSLVAKHMADMGVAKILICNRGAERAQQLATELAHSIDVEVIPFADLEQHLHRADVISSCTGSLHQVIDFKSVKSALKRRRYQQMLLVDLAVPRDIDPKVDILDGVYLYGVDDLQTVIDENLAQRRQAAVEAEVMVNQLAMQLVSHQKLRHAGGVISAYRDAGHHIQQQELALALQHLEAGEDAAEVMKNFAHRLTNKLLHPASILLREAVKEDEPEYFEWLKTHLQQILRDDRANKYFD